MSTPTAEIDCDLWIEITPAPTEDEDTTVRVELPHASPTPMQAAFWALRDGR